MHFKIFMSMLAVATLMLSACNKKCNENQDLVVGKWTNNIGNYYFYKDQSYTYKYLGAQNPSDTISIADSALGTYKIDQCQKVVSLTQTGYFPRGNNTDLVQKNIAYGTWKFKLIADTLLEIETSSTFLKLNRVQKF